MLHTVQEEFTRRADLLLEKQDCLRELSDWSYNSQVYGQDVYRQQALILNYNILRTFCNNLMRHFKAKATDCNQVLCRLVQEAFDCKAMCFQAAEYYVDIVSVPAQNTMQTLTQISIWPLHEPVVSSYDDRKVALSQRWEAANHPKCTMPPIYIPRIYCGDVDGFLKITEDKVAFVTSDTIPHEIAASRHFKWVKEIVQNGSYALNHYETDPTRKSNWLYYCVMFDPTVSPEAADQGYIGKTTRDLVTRWKEHTGQKGECDEMLIHYNLALVSEYARQRGEDLSEYVAVFALGTITDESVLTTTEGMLIRKAFRDGFGVTNMKYGMNCKQSSANLMKEQLKTNKQSRNLQAKGMKVTIDWRSRTAMKIKSRRNSFTHAHVPS